MEFKWLMIAFAVIMCSIAIGDAASKYQVNQCRQAAIAHNYTTEQIKEICK